MSRRQVNMVQVIGVGIIIILAALALLAFLDAQNRGKVWQGLAVSQNVIIEPSETFPPAQPVSCVQESCDGQDNDCDDLVDEEDACVSLPSAPEVRQPKGYIIELKDAPVLVKKKELEEKQIRTKAFEIEG